MNTGSGRVASFLRKNNTFCRDVEIRIDAVPVLDLDDHAPKTTVSAFEPCGSYMLKKWFHKLKWGSIPMKTTHRVTKATICKIPKVVRMCNSRAQYCGNR
jgi:hypothetical protein